MAKSLIFEDAEKARNAITISQRKEISNLYVEWAKDIDELANYYKLKTTKSAPIVESQLRDLYKQIKQASDDVLKETQGVIVKNMYTMSKEMVDANSRWLSSIGFNVGDFDVAFSNVPKNVVERLVNGQIYDSSWSLSKSIWGDSQKTQKDLYTLVAKGVAQNKPIYDIAKDLERYVNPKKISKWNFEAKDGVKIYKKAVDYNSQRLARTLVQHSYQQSFIETTKHNPFVQKYKWVSNGSRVCDICLERDGKTYSKDELPMDHPNGMCTMEIVVSDTLTDDIANWINESDGTYPDIDDFAKRLGYSPKKIVNVPKKPDVAVPEIKYSKTKSGKGLNSKGWEDSLESNELKAIKDYQSSTSLINKLLSKGDPLPDYYEKMRIGLDNGLAKNEIKKNIVTYRGGGLEELGLTPIIKSNKAQRLAELEEFVKNDTFKYTGYMSTSIDKKATEYFASDLTYEIRVPKGTKGAYISSLVNNENEKEVLLSRGNEFRIVDKKIKIDEYGWPKLKLVIELIK